ASFRGSRVRTSTFVMIGFAVLFGLLAVFLAQIWLNNQADERLKSIDAQRKAAPPARSIVVASKPLRFGDELTSAALREMPWPDNALPAGAFGKIADLTAAKRVVLMPIDINEAVLAAKITGPGQRATLSAMLSDGMKAVTIRVNDVEGVAGFVLPGERVDVVLTRTGEKNNAVNDVVLQNVRVLAIDQLADQRADKRRVTTHDLMTAPAQESHFVTIGVMRPSRGERVEYTVPVEEGDAHSAALPNQLPAR